MFHFKEKDALVFFAAFGDGAFAAWLRKMAYEFGKTILQFMVFFWIWTYWPTIWMIFILLFVVLGWKAFRQYYYLKKFEKNEKKRVVQCLKELEEQWKDRYE